MQNNTRIMTDDPYRRLARAFDLIFDPLNKGLRIIGLKMYRPEAGAKILDVGCGTGTHLALYRKFECSLHGIDASESMLRIAKERLGDKADLQLAHADALPFEHKTFDLVVSMLVLHEMEPSMRPAVLNEMKRVLKDDGRILLIDFHTGPYRVFKGWLTKIVIILSEMLAGRRHFRHYRQFMSVRGLPPLIEAEQLVVEQERIVGGGTFVLGLLRKSVRIG